MSFQDSTPGQPQSPKGSNRQIEVADRAWPHSEESCLDLSLDPETQDVADYSAYTTFLKRNLRPLAPPADLLGNIRAALAAVDAEKG